VQVIRNWLIVEVPWIKFIIHWPFPRHNRLLSREDFHTHPAHFSECFTLSFNVCVRPSEHFDDTTLLTVFIGSILVNSGILPNEIGGFRRDCEFFALSVSCLDSEGESAFEGASSCVLIVGGIPFIVPVVFHLGD
jgi:hypothetical protein